MWIDTAPSLVSAPVGDIEATRIRDRVEAEGLIVAGGPLVVMLSGGRDSVCLLSIAAELRATATALHVNYGLRGEESDADERHCRHLCDSLGIDLVAERPESAPSGNKHAWAREVRYAYAADLGGRLGARIAVAHTETDQLETILYRLATSPGRRALLGMPVRRGDVVRPLLAAGLTREDTAAYCRGRGLGWREDSANADRDYARARVRADLLPALLVVDARAHGNVLRTAELLRDEAEVLDALVADALGGRDSIALGALAGLPPALGRLVLRQLSEDATGRSGARAAARLGDVLALGEGMLDLGDGARVVVEGGVVSVIRH